MGDLDLVSKLTDEERAELNRCYCFDFFGVIK